MLALHLPLPPSVNHLYHRSERGVVLTDQARLYRDEAAWLVRSAVAAAREQPATTDRLHVTVRFRFGDRRRRDLDNPLKLLLDAVCAGLAVDDSQIDELHVYRALDRMCPRAEVLLTWSVHA